MLPVAIFVNVSYGTSDFIPYRFQNGTCAVWNTSSDGCSNSSTQGPKSVAVHLGGLSWALIALYTLTFIVGLVGNALVCFAVWRNKNMRTVTNIFLVNLAAADLGVIIVCLPPALIADITNKWLLGTAFCKIHLFLSVSTRLDKHHYSSFCSSWFLLI